MVGDSISKGFSVASKSFNLVLVLFVFGAIFNVLSILWTPETVEPGVLPPPLLIGLAVVFFASRFFFQSGSMAYLRDALKTGSHSMTSFKANGGKYYLRLLVLFFVFLLIVGTFFVLSRFVPELLAAVPMAGVLLAILFAALGIYFSILLTFAPHAAVVDDQGVGASLKTSMRLVKKNIFSLIGLLILNVLIAFGVGLIIGGLYFGILFIVKSEQTAAIIFAIPSSFVSALLEVFLTATIMNYYLRLDRTSH